MKDQNTTIGITTTSIFDRNFWNKVLVNNLVKHSVLINNFEDNNSKFELEKKIKSEFGIDNIQVLSEYDDYESLNAIFHFGQLDKYTYPKNYKGKRIVYLDFKLAKEILNIKLFETNRIDFIICDFFPDECIDIPKEVRDYISKKFIFLPTFLDIEVKKPKNINETIIVKDKYKLISNNCKNTIKENLRQTFLNALSESANCKLIEIEENRINEFIVNMTDNNFDKIVLSTEDPRINNIVHFICSINQINISIFNKVWPSFYRFTPLNNRSPWMIRENNISKDQSIRSIFNSYLDTIQDNQTLNYSFNIEDENYFNDIIQIVCSNLPSEKIKDPYLAASIDIQNDFINNTRDKFKFINYFESKDISSEDPNIISKLTSLLCYSISNQRYIDENISFFSFVVSKSLEIFFKSNSLSQKQYYTFANIINTYPQAIKLLIYKFEVDHRKDIAQIKNFLYLILYSVTNYKINNFEKILDSCISFTEKLLLTYKDNSNEDYLHNIVFLANLLLNKCDLNKNQLRITKKPTSEGILWRDYSFSVQQYTSLYYDDLIYKRKNINVTFLHDLLDKSEDNLTNNDLYIWNKARCFQFENKFSSAHSLIKSLSESAPIIYYTLLSYEAFLMGNKEISLNYLNQKQIVENNKLKFEIFRAALLLLCDDQHSFRELLSNKQYCKENWILEPQNYTQVFSIILLRKASGIDSYESEFTSDFINNRIVTSSFIKISRLVSFGNYVFSQDLKELLLNNEQQLSQKT